MDFDTFPPVTDAILKALSDKFPDRCPDVHEDMNEVRAKAGEQRVLAFLRSINQHQHEQGNVLLQTKSDSDARA